jgi:hypothetical protein
MSIRRLATAVALVLAGAAAGAVAAKRILISPTVYQGKEKAQAAAGLLAAARELAADGTYENIAVGRVLYLPGKKDEGRAIFDRVLAGKHAAGDVVRVARVYQEAGEWKTRSLRSKRKKILSRFGTVKTTCRCGTSARSWRAHSTQTSSRFWWHDGQRHLSLQEKAIRKSCPHSAQCARAAPWAKMPQSIYLSTAFSTERRRNSWVRSKRSS